MTPKNDRSLTAPDRYRVAVAKNQIDRYLCSPAYRRGAVAVGLEPSDRGSVAPVLPGSTGGPL